MRNIRQIVAVLFIFCVVVTILGSKTQVNAEERLVTTTPVENCEEYYQKAYQHTIEAEQINPDGIFNGARKGGLAGTAAAWASLYQACLFRNHLLEQKSYQ